MSPFVWGMIVGAMFIGAPFGYLAAALMAAASRGDRR